MIVRSGQSKPALFIVQIKSALVRSARLRGLPFGAARSLVAVIYILADGPQHDKRCEDDDALALIQINSRTAVCPISDLLGLFFRRLNSLSVFNSWSGFDVD